MLSKPKTNSMKRTFGYAAAKDWNYNSKNSKSIHYFVIYIFNVSLRPKHFLVSFNIFIIVYIIVFRVLIFF